MCIIWIGVMMIPSQTYYICKGNDFQRFKTIPIYSETIIIIVLSRFVSSHNKYCVTFVLGLFTNDIICNLIVSNCIASRELVFFKFQSMKNIPPKVFVSNFFLRKYFLFISKAKVVSWSVDTENGQKLYHPTNIHRDTLQKP